MGTKDNFFDGDAFQDAMLMLDEIFHRILKVDLTQNTYSCVKNDKAQAEEEVRHTHFDSMVWDFARQGNVHEEDLATFMDSLELNRLRHWVERGERGNLFVYRRKREEEFRWASLEVWPASDYSPQQQKVLLYVRDIHEEYSEQLAQRMQIEKFVYTDQLTGLQNRLAYTRCCSDYLAQMNRHSVGVIFADVNGLKYVNDNYGHRSGDEYLLTFSAALQNSYGTKNCYRISGDEFLVVLEYYNQSHFADEVEKLKSFLAEQPSPMAAIGVYWMDAPPDIEVVEREAEKAMYLDKQHFYESNATTAKDRGRDCRSIEIDVEQILAKQESLKGDIYYEPEEADRTGLASRIFDVFDSTVKRNYFYLTNLQTNVSRWSKRAVVDFDLPGEYMYQVEDIWIERIHPEDREMFRQSIQDVFSGRVSRHDVVYRVRNAEGSYVICACEGTIIKGNGDEPDYFSGSITNYGIKDAFDGITHLPSKTAFLSRLKDLTIDDRCSCVMLIVIDMFSNINMLYGWQAGEDILRQYGEALQKIVGDRGQVYHIDSGTFGVCMEESGEDEAKTIYRRIRQMGYEGIQVDGKRITIKTLGGASVFGYARGEDSRINSHLSYVIGLSRTVYHGELVFFDVLAHRHELSDRDLLGVIYQDVMNHCRHFQLYYQPVVDAYTEMIVGAEALIRWKQEPYGMIPPNRFIPFMEQSPCIYELGNWVIQNAIRDAKKMRERLPHFIININVAPLQLERQEFKEDVIRMLKEADYPPENLCLELTERCRGLDPDFLREQALYFQQHGVRVAMDDFGTGNASLQLVMELPLDEVKIDRSFVQDIENQRVNQALVSAIVSGARVINAQICIEGVENEAQSDYLKRFNPTYYQGYHYSKPVPVEEFMNLIS